MLIRFLKRFFYFITKKKCRNYGCKNRANLLYDDFCGEKCEQHYMSGN